jgi:ABC-2 type transport system permease protein
VSELQKYFEIFRVEFKNNWVREAVYRTNFVTMVVTDLVWIIVEASFFKVIYAHTDSLAGWTLEQAYFFLGMFFASDALFNTFLGRNFWSFSDLIAHGELDVVLTKPANPLFLALTRWMSLTTLLNFGLGIGIMAYFGQKAGFEGGWGWLNIAFWLLIGVAAQGLLRFAFSVWVFWTDRGWALTRLYFQFFALATKPHTIYPSWARYTILTALPFALIGSVPAAAVIHGLEPWEYVWSGLILVAFLLFNLWMWSKGLKRYQSASS